MGSKLRHSSRRSKASHSSSRQISPASRPARLSSDFDALLERFSNALSIIATAARALNLAQAEVQPVPGHDIGEDILTLEHGIEALRGLYNELDVAIREVRA